MPTMADILRARGKLGPYATPADEAPPVSEELGRPVEPPPAPPARAVRRGRPV